MKKRDISKEDIDTNKLVQIALDIDLCVKLELNIELNNSNSVKEQPPIVIKLGNTKLHGAILFHFIKKNLIYFNVLDVNGIMRIISKINKFSRLS